MKAIFSGSLAAGFGIQEVVEDGDAAAIVMAVLAKGQLAEALEIQCPRVLNLRAVPSFEGTNYVVFGTGLGNTFEIFGPFQNATKAEEFGELCGEDSEWELFVAPETNIDDSNELNQDDSRNIDRLA